MRNLLIRICDALFCVLLLCSAILAEGVEVSAGEQVAVNFRQSTESRVSKVQDPDEIRRENLHGLVVVYSQ